jgi:glycosyltransferase involved in cell wall biosynthesis
MKPPIKVLFYEPYPMGLGGNFRTQRLILGRLDRTRFTPFVVAPIDGVALDEFRKMGVECLVMSPPGTLDRYGGAVLRAGILGRMKVAIDLLLYNLKLTRFLRERQIDVVYANCVRAEMSIGIAARLAGVPSLLYIKGELDNPVIDLLSFMLASKMLFFCEQNRDDKYPRLVRAYRQKIDILKIGLDPSVIENVDQKDKAALREELAIDQAYINVVVLAQLYRPKGQHIVLEALSKLVADFPKVRLYLLGDHVIDQYRPYKEELDKIIAKNGIEEYVRFIGWRRDALDVVALMDIMIHPSLAEGFGRAVLESMALGKPVIASKVGGLREAIKDGKNGFLVEPGDADAIERRWRELLTKPEMRMRLGQEAKKTVFAEYLIDDKVARLAEIWTEMARGRG